MVCKKTWNKSLVCIDAYFNCFQKRFLYLIHSNIVLQYAAQYLIRSPFYSITKKHLFFMLLIKLIITVFSIFFPFFIDKNFQLINICCFSFFNPVFHDVPHIFNRIEIRTIGWSVHNKWNIGNQASFSCWRSVLGVVILLNSTFIIKLSFSIVNQVVFLYFDVIITALIFWNEWQPTVPW